MKKILILFIALAVSACNSNRSHPLYQPSNVKVVSDYHTFDEYIEQTKQQLLAHRTFLTQDKQAELQANLPAEFLPEGDTKPQKGILLIHGLGDSPYSFVDIAKSLQEKGMLVRTALLAGHGTKPGDLLTANYQDWNALIKKQVALLKQEVGEIYLGGFSTGGNLAYSYAAQDDDIAGLMLFSPGFVSGIPLAFTVPWISGIKPWLLDIDPSKFNNYTRYVALPTNGFSQYYKTSQEAVEALEKAPYTKPTFMVLTEHDSVLDTQAIKHLFDTRFTNPKNKLLWFGALPDAIEGNTRNIHSYNEKLRISNMSHMGILFSPDNPYYGIAGTQRICRNGADMTQEEITRCRNGEQVWYSAWGARANENIHARLTFNPWYQIMMQDLSSTFSLPSEK